MSQKPDVDPHLGDAPTDLEITDLVEGDGAEATSGSTVSVHYVAPKGHYPLALGLFLPESWVADAGRLDRAGVPAEHRRDRTKGQIALDLLDRVRAEGLPGRVVLADAGYNSDANLTAAGPDRLIALGKRRDDQRA